MKCDPKPKAAVCKEKAWENDAKATELEEKREIEQKVDSAAGPRNMAKTSRNRGINQYQIIASQIQI